MYIDIQLSHLNKTSNRRFIHKISKKVDVNDVNIGRVKVKNELLSLEEKKKLLDFIGGKLKLNLINEL